MADPAAPDPSPARTDPPAVDPKADPSAATPEAPAEADPAAKPDASPDVKAEPAKAEAPVVPEKYDFAKVELPKGIALDQPLIDAVSPVFKELGISQQNAEKLVKAHAEHLAATETKREADFKSWMATTVKGYQDSLKKEWGGSYDANLAVAQRGIARLADAEMKQLLDDTGLGSHPKFVKAFYEVGKMVSEDKPPNGATPPGARKSAAEVLYGATQ
jgi:hypothetical protein